MAMKELSPQEQELLLAVITNDIDLVKKLLPLHESTGFIDDIGQKKLPFPLHYVTLCNKTRWRYPEEWSDTQMAIKINHKVNKMFNFWKEYMNIDTFPEIDYISFCEDAWNLRWDNDICGEEATEYIKAGYTEKDIELYIAAKHFELNRVEKLLNEGVNPNIWLSLTNDDSNSINAINSTSVEMMHLIDELYNIIIGECKDCYWVRLHQLAALAANSEMYRLLSKYKKEE
jgi:hypothetical protein